MGIRMTSCVHSGGLLTSARVITTNANAVLDQNALMASRLKTSLHRPARQTSQSIPKIHLSKGSSRTGTGHRDAVTVTIRDLNIAIPSVMLMEMCANKQKCATTLLLLHAKTQLNQAINHSQQRITRPAQILHHRCRAQAATCKQDLSKQETLKEHLLKQSRLPLARYPQSFPNPDRKRPRH